MIKNWLLKIVKNHEKFTKKWKVTKQNYQDNQQAIVKK